MPPIVVALSAFAAGAMVLQAQAALPPFAAAIALSGAAAAALALRSFGATRIGRGALLRSIARWSALVLGAALAGFGYAAWRAELRLADQLPAQWEGEDIALVGVVDELPSPGPYGIRFTLAVESIGTTAAIVPSRLSLGWYARPPNGVEDNWVPDAMPEVHAGERWALTVRLMRPHGSVNPAGFDLEAWLLEHDLRATGYVRPGTDNARLDAFAGRPGDYVERTRERIRDRIFRALPDAPYAGVLAALVVGDQRSIPQSQWLVFNRTGVSHLISISGLHVSAFAALAGGFAFLLLRRSTRLTTRCPARKPALAIGWLASAAYVALAGAQVPALRTLAMLGAMGIGLAVGRPGTGRLIWLWSLVAVLALDPFAPLAAGFWLSFGAVAVLIYALGSRIGHGPPLSRIGRIRAALAEGARTQWAVTVGLVPFTLALFGQLSLVSPIANALAIPLVTFVVVPLALIAALLPIDLLWTIAHAALVPLMRVLEALAALPAAAWQQHAPPAWTVAAGTAGILLVLAPRGLPGRALGALWLVPLAWIVPPAPAPGAAFVAILDVGQGLAVAVRTATHALLYDTGPRYNETADAGGRIVAPYLRAAGMRALDGLVVSHRDTDHSGGALSVLATAPVGWLSSSLEQDSAIVVRQLALGAPVMACAAGQQWTWDGVRFTMLHPGVDAYADAARKSNDRSCVLRIDTAHGSLLLTGDAEARSEYEMLARDAKALRADVLIVPHHGSRTSSTRAFITAVAPSIAVITAGYRNRFGHPRPDIVARYAERGVELARTDYDGAVIVRLEGEAPRIERWRRVAARYWHDPFPD